MNYSLLNDYHYQNKNSMISALDFLSTPVRCILGGKEISINNRSDQNNASSIDTIDKVILASCLIVVFPIGIISGGSFLLDLIAKKCVKEKDIVKNLSSLQKTTAASRPHFQLSQTNKVAQVITIANEPNHTNNQSSDLSKMQANVSHGKQQNSVKADVAPIPTIPSIPQAVETIEEKPSETIQPDASKTVVSADVQNASQSNDTNHQSNDLKRQANESNSKQQSSINTTDEAPIPSTSATSQAVENIEEKPSETIQSDAKILVPAEAQSANKSNDIDHQSNDPQRPAKQSNSTQQTSKKKTDVPTNSISGKQKFTAREALQKETGLTLSEWSDILSNEPPAVIEAVIANQKRLVQQKSVEQNELNDGQAALDEQRKLDKQNQLKRQLHREFFVLLESLAANNQSSHPEIEKIRSLTMSFCSSSFTTRARVNQFRATLQYKLNKLIPSLHKSERALTHFRNRVNSYCTQIVAELIE